MTTKRRCYHCDKEFTEAIVDHAHRYDHGAPIQLRSIAKCSCDGCGYSEVAIPRMEVLHAAIAAALGVPGVDRAGLAFVFERGSRGIEDGAWRQTPVGKPDEAPVP